MPTRRISADAASAARLLESIHDVLVRRPTALFVDDVQWADASTIAVLDYLAHRAGSVPLVVVAAARDDEGGSLERLPIADGRRFSRLLLGRLSREDVANQVTGLTGSRPDPRTLERIFKRTDGNPFFVEQVVEGAAGPGGLDEVPATLRLFVQRRVNRLPPAVLEVLEALAVIGRRADLETIVAVAARDDGMSRRAAEAAVRDAVASGLAIADQDGVDVRHPLVREVIVDALARSDRERLHRRAAETAAGRGWAATEVADHWWRSDDRRRAWSWALAAADVAESALAFPETRMHLDRAIERWPNDEPGRTEAMLRSARAAWLMGDADAALATVLAAEASAGPPTIELLLARGGYAWDAGERRLAAEAFDRTIDLTTTTTPPGLRATAYWGVGRARVADGRFDDAAAMARTSAEFALAARDEEAEASAWLLFAMCRGLAGSLDGIPDLSRGVELAVRSGVPSAIGHAYQFLVDLTGLDGRGIVAIDLARLGIDRCERLGLARSHGSDLRGRAALLLLEAGRWDEATDILEPAEPRAFPLLARAMLAMRRGEVGEVASTLAAAAVGGSIGGPGALGGWLELAENSIEPGSPGTEGPPAER